MCFWTAENESKNTREMFYDHFIVTIEQSQLNDKYIVLLMTMMQKLDTNI